MDPVLTEASIKIQDTTDHLKMELSAIRAGRANPSLVENITVNVYGGQMKLNEVGTISAPQPSLLTIQIWDASVVHDIQKALQEANLGLNPSVEGQTIRLPIPPLTEERRIEFVKIAQKRGEDAKIAIRQIRADERNAWIKLREGSEIGEDEFGRREKLLQDLIDRQVSFIEELVKQKETELTTL